MLDHQLGVLSNAHRRQVLLTLLQDDSRDNRTVIAGGSDASDEERDRMIAMEHVHFPRLEDHGYVNWDPKEGRVTKGSQFDEIKPLLIVLNGMQDEFPAGGSLD